MRIGELARRTGASTRALRHYEACGLLAPERGTNGYRDYPAEAVERVGHIRLLLDAKLTLEEIAPLLPCFDVAGEPAACPAMLRALRDKAECLDGKIDRLRAARDLIVDTERRLAAPTA